MKSIDGSGFCPNVAVSSVETLLRFPGGTLKFTWWSKAEDDSSFILIDNLDTKEDADRESDYDQEHRTELDEPFHAMVVAFSLRLGFGWWMSCPAC